MSKPLWNEYYCSTDPNGLNIIVDWETNVLTEKVKEYNDRYYVKRLKLGKEYDIIAVISKQWDMCFLIDIEDSFLIGHFDLFYIQYNDHYFEFSPDGISGKKGYCQYADLENEWLSCYDKFDVSDAYLDLEGNIAHADIYYKDPRDNSNVMDVWGIIQYIMENGYCNGYPASSLLRAGVSHSFEDFCEGKQYATFRVKITRNAFEDDYSGMISFELSSEGLSFDVKDDDWGRIYLFIGRQRDYFYIDEYNTENLTQIDFSEWPYVEILDLLN